MGINILDELNELSKQGMRFKGAVFLTYSLNLQFFEQLVQPKLDMLGCGNVLIISDEFGYQEAIRHNIQQINHVGRQYVCAALRSEDLGVQHSKMLMLIAEDHAWMLLGSGNLTLYGYGHNLELFDKFEWNGHDDESYAFRIVWQLIEKIKPSLSKIAQDQIQHMAEIAPWITNLAAFHNDYEIWHSFDTPLSRHIFQLGQVDELQLIAPFFDLNTIERLILHFGPLKLWVGGNALNPNIDVDTLTKLCQSLGCELEIRVLDPIEANVARGLHAKAIVGIHSFGAWAIVGSANITRPAIEAYWKHNGNLETVVYRQSNNPNAFQELFENDLISSRPLSSSDIAPMIEETSKTARPSIHLDYLIARKHEIEGFVSFSQIFEPKNLSLLLTFTKQEYPITLDTNNRFLLRLDKTLTHAETGRLVFDCGSETNCESNSVFVDQADELQTFGARSFHFAMRGKLELVSTASNVFKELMEFLFNRTNNNQDVSEYEESRRQQRKQRRLLTLAQTNDDDYEVLPADAFITDEELSMRISGHIDSLNHYERDHYSLRDLLSLVLMRLSTETVSSQVIDTAVERDELENIHLEAQRREQRSFQEELRKYLSGYCKRYSLCLQDTQFILNRNAALLFQNQLTLVRVLLEFHQRTDVFTSQILREMVRQIWIPFFKDKGVLSVLQAWEGVWLEEHLSSAFVMMIASAWQGSLPDFYSDIESVQRFMFVQKLITDAEFFLGKTFWNSIQDEDKPSADLLECFEALAKFKTPTAKRYARCIQIIKLRQNGLENSEQAQRLISYLQSKEPELFELVRSASAIVSVVGDSEYCPVTHFELPTKALSELRSEKKLIFSPHNRQTLLYWVPEYDPEIAL
jgi:hypothetical protein